MHSFDVQMLIDRSDYADVKDSRTVMPLRWSFDGVCLLFLLAWGTSGAIGFGECIWAENMVLC